MFRDDKATVKRAYTERYNGEIQYKEPIVIKKDIPCHLSVKTLSSINQTQSTATVLYDFVLFYSANIGLKIQPNDIIEVITKYGETYSLRAGKSKQYNMTVQTHCEENNIA